MDLKSLPLLLVLFVSIFAELILASIQFTCTSDKLLVVQSMRKGSIRMHCQRAEICGIKANCDYFQDAFHCPGRNYFASGVFQANDDSSVVHTCCAYRPHLRNHIANDCFIYSVTDGERYEVGESLDVDSNPSFPFPGQRQDDDPGRFKLRLYRLRHKSAAEFLVKSIEKRRDGFNVTVCRTRCEESETQPAHSTKSSIIIGSPTNPTLRIRTTTQSTNQEVNKGGSSMTVVSTRTMRPSSYRTTEMPPFVTDDGQKRTNPSAHSPSDNGGGGTGGPGTVQQDPSTGGGHMNCGGNSGQGQGNSCTTEGTASSTDSTDSTDTASTSSQGSGESTDGTTANPSTNGQGAPSTSSVSGTNVGADESGGSESGVNAAAQRAAVTSTRPVGCFTGDQTVVTQTGIRRVDELRIGDKVVVAQSANALIYDTIESFYHRDPHTETDYLTITTASNRTLTLSRTHLMPLVSCSDELPDDLDAFDQIVEMSLFAERANVGDCVATVDENGRLMADRIEMIVPSLRRGLYAPVTSKGSIVVNHYHVSCYAVYENHRVQHMFHMALQDMYLVTRWLLDVETYTGIPKILTTFLGLTDSILPFATAVTHL